MNREIKSLIYADKKCNVHPKNRAFIFLYRYGSYYYNKSKFFSILFRIAIKLTVNMHNHIPLNCVIGSGIRLPHLLGIVISGNAVIGKNCTIYHQVTIGVDDKSDKAATIGDNCIIGAGAKIIGNVNIGNNVRIGAGAVVTKDVPDNATVIQFNKVLM